MVAEGRTQLLGRRSSDEATLGQGVGTTVAAVDKKRALFCCVAKRSPLTGGKVRAFSNHPSDPPGGMWDLYRLDGRKAVKVSFSE